jgi:beta-N-acetylglucosaminidase
MNLRFTITKKLLKVISRINNVTLDLIQEHQFAKQHYELWVIDHVNRENKLFTFADIQEMRQCMGNHYMHDNSKEYFLVRVFNNTRKSICMNMTNPLRPSKTLTSCTHTKPQWY